MINKNVQVMIYVKDVEEVAKFWAEKVGFTKLETNMMENEILSIEIKPTNDADISFILFNCEIVKKFSPEISLATPSILFSSCDLQKTRNELISKGVTVGEIVDMGGRLSFNFSDNEGNYFAVQEVKSK